MLFKSLAVSALAGVALSQDLTTLLASTPQLTSLATYLGFFPDLTATLGSLSNITLLAPNNNAFSKLLNSTAGAALAANDTAAIQALFTYHVLNGSYPTLNGTQFIPTLLGPGMYANVTGGQVVEAIGRGNSSSFISGLLANSSATGTMRNFTGGVVHIIDEVLTVPANISSTANSAGLTGLVGAVTNASLATTLDGLTDVTIFAPNNAAFEAIGSALPNLTTSQLTSILQYHVVQGTVGYSTNLTNGTKLQTLSNSTLNIRLEGSDVYVNNARVVVPNVLVANGVIHVIDQVLNPSNTTASANPSKSTGVPAFSGASSASSIAYTSNVPAASTTLATQSAAGATGSGSGSGSSSSSSGLAMPMKTGAVGAAALFGGAALVMNM